MTIRTVIKIIQKLENIKTKEQLYRWCGKSGLKKLYDYVKGFAPDNWNRIENPEESVRSCLQELIIGYKRCKL